MNSQIASLLNTSVAQLQENRFSDAEKTLNNVLKIQPKNSDALCFMGIVLISKLEFREALRLFNKSLEGNKNNPIALKNQGYALLELKKYSDALLSYEKAIHLQPSDPEAHNNKGNTLQALKRNQDAIVSYDKAIALAPDYVDAHSNKGNALQSLKRFEEAIKSYEKALLINPRYGQGWNNKGLAHRFLKEYKESLDCFDQAILCQADNHQGWLEKGFTLFELHYYADALICFDKILISEVNHPKALTFKGMCLEKLGKYAESITCFQSALLQDPNAEFLIGYLIRTKQLAADWDQLDNLVKILQEKVSSGIGCIVPFAALSVVDESAFHLQVAKLCVSNTYPPKGMLPPIPRVEHKKIRIGYFSADFKNHPVSLLTAELFEIHHRDRFEVYAFSLKDAPAGDETRMRLEVGFDHFINLAGKSDLELVEIVRKLEIDIAIDLGGHTEYGPIELFSYRLAPIQVGYLGYPGTTGAEYMDYLVADKTLVPEESQRYYSEKIIYLPDTYMVDDSKRQPSSRQFSRAEQGLPEDKFIFCCFNNTYKFNHKILESWTKILINVPESILWISEGHDLFQKNILKEFEILGIHHSRLIFAKRVDLIGDHLSRLSLADLFLDTIPFNAHSTAVDSLKAGLPILTCMGQAFAGRVAGSLLNGIGIPELIARDISDYESIAINLAKNPAVLMKLRAKLAEHKISASLFNTRLFASNLELAYQETYSRYLSNQPLGHISI